MIGYYIHHSGGGHLARARAIIAHLPGPVTCLSSLPRPADLGADIEWIHLADDANPAAADGTYPAGDDPTAGGALHYASLGHPGHTERMAQIAAFIAAERPRAMVVDVSMEVTLFARLAGVPVVMVGMRGQRDDRPHQAGYDAATSIIACWPQQTTDASWPQVWVDKTVAVGGISRLEGLYDTHASGQTELPANPRVAVLWGKGNRGAGNTVASAVIASMPPGWRAEPVGVTDAQQVARVLASADLVVSHAGQNAVAECASIGRPTIIVAEPRPHDEQLGTVTALETHALCATATSRPRSTEQWTELAQVAARRSDGRFASWISGGGAPAAAAEIARVAGARLPHVVIIVSGRHTHLRHALAGLHAGLLAPAGIWVVSMGDDEIEHVVSPWPQVNVLSIERHASGNLPLGAARNTGARAAFAAGAPGVVFVDVDCVAAPDMVTRYARAMGRGEGLFCGPVTYLTAEQTSRLHATGEIDPAWRNPHAARPNPAPGQVAASDNYDLVWSLSLAMTRETYTRIGGFSEDYCGYGGEDTDLAYAARKHGVPLYWVGGADAYHQYHPVSSPPVEHLCDIVRNARVFAHRWGTLPMRGWLDAFADQGLVTIDGESVELTARGEAYTRS